MLGNRKNVIKFRKVLTVIIAIIMILCIYINIRYFSDDINNIVEIKTISTENLKHVNSSNAEDTQPIQPIATFAEKINLDDGKTVIPEYKPEWTKVSSSIDTANKTLTVILKGSAYIPTEELDSNVAIKYASDVTSSLDIEDIQIFISGVDETSKFTNKDVAVNTSLPMKELKTGTTTTNATTGKTETTYELVLYNFEESTRRAGVPYKQLSGNIALKIKGRGKATTTYGENTLQDGYGNQSMMESDEGQTAGTWVDVRFQDEEVTQNTNGKMFTDFIKPEFTYKYAGTSRDVTPNPTPEIDYTNKKVIVTFDVVDKYFNSTTLASDSNANNITVIVDGDSSANTKVTKELTKVDDIYDSDGTTKIGERYQLVISKLEQNPNDGFEISGPMTLTFAGGIATDKSGNTNNAKSITIGIDSNDSMPNTPYTSPYLPEGYKTVIGTDLNTGFVIEDSNGNQYVWVEVPKTKTVYTTAGLSITEFTDSEYTKIANDLRAYSSKYSNGYSDQYVSEASQGMTSTEYDTQWKKMLKSVYKNGGFYVGRYETGIEDSFRYFGTDYSTEHTVTETPVIKQNAYPFNWVTRAQAQTLSESFATDGYSTSLMFGVQWNLMLRYLVAKGSTSTELTSEATWGNLSTTVANITNTDAKYGPNDGNTWYSAPYNKTAGTVAFLTTGATEQFKKQNIYDIFGNVFEYTLEYSENSSEANAMRGCAANDRRF